MYRPFVTGSIARSATRRYLSYSETNFDVFRPARATRCTDWCETLIGATIRVQDPKTEICTEI